MSKIILFIDTNTRVTTSGRTGIKQVRISLALCITYRIFEKENIPDEKFDQVIIIFGCVMRLGMTIYSIWEVVN